MKPEKPLSTFDLLKTVMVVVMVIDHIGFFFLPEYPVLRAVGRLGAPAWFFLAGYAARRDRNDMVLWLAAALMIGGKYVLLDMVLPLNILLNLVLMRVVVARGGAYVQRWPLFLLPLLCVLIAFNPLLYTWLEYGALAPLFGLLGWLLRNAAQPSHKTVAAGWGAACIIFFIGQQATAFHFSLPNALIMAAGSLAMFVALVRFSPQPIKVGIIAPLLRFCGRQTLLIYVVHYLTFALIMRFFV